MTYAFSILIDDIARLPTVWYSICAVLNPVSHKVRLTVNRLDLIKEDSIHRLDFFSSHHGILGVLIKFTALSQLNSW